MRFFHQRARRGQGHGATTANTANCTSHEEVNPETMSAATRPGAKPDADKAHRQRLHDDERDEQCISQTRKKL